MVYKITDAYFFFEIYYFKNYIISTPKIYITTFITNVYDLIDLWSDITCINIPIQGFLQY